MGDILVLAERYRNEGADEVVFYDITASPEGRSVDRTWVSRVANILDIPFCVAGGIRSVEDAEAVLNAGAEKISINSPAISNPGLIEELAARFGSQCVVIGIDSANVKDGYKRVPVHGRSQSLEQHRAGHTCPGCAKCRNAAPVRSCSTA